MPYFRELPDVLYQSNLLHKISSQEYVAIKNLFRRVKIADSVQDQVTLYEKYVIEEKQRPDNVAERMYGRPDYDWIVVLTANITNIKDEWPLDNANLYEYVVNKYGLENINKIHHRETIEVRDSRGRLILPAGLKVDETFTIPAPLSTNPYTAIGAFETIPVTNNASGKVPNAAITVGISNFEYETDLNEDKREIFVMKPSYLMQYLNEIRQIMNYKESSQYIDDKLIATENTRLLGP